MKSSLGDKARLQHIVSAIEEIETYTAGFSYPQFESNSMMQFACVKQLEIVGEAANHVSQHLKNQHTEIQWREITDLRNILVHEYFGIDARIVWSIIQNDLKEIKPKILDMLLSV